MIQRKSGRLLGGLFAFCLGIVITCWGLVLTRDQLVLAMRTQSMKPICDASRNAVTAALTPVITFGGDLVDYGIGAFLLLFLINSLVWATGFYMAGRAVTKLMSGLRRKSESAV